MSDLYEHVTSDVLSDFDGSGTQALLELINAHDHSSEATSMVFTEILMSVQAQLVSIEKVAQFLQIAITDEEKANVFCSVFDVFPLDQPLKDLFNEIYVTHQIITPATLAQCIDSSKLCELAVLPAETFNRQMNSRKRDQYFTQKKFNLLHEEFEGYSILISEFHSMFTSENNCTLIDYALDVVSSLIGHYLLDPNRVLDVIIDMSSGYVVGNVDFLMGFLRKSPWWPTVEADCVSGLHTLAQGGCTTASSSIALRLLKQQKDRDFSDTFKALVCIFMKEGFVSFGSIYSQLAVTDEEMDQLQNLYKADLDDQVFRASASALSLAAPLSEEGEEGNPNKKEEEATKKPASLESLLKHNTKLQLLKSLLAVGLYWPSIYILSEYPFLAHVDKDVAFLMHRMLSVMIEPLHGANSLLNPNVLAEFQKERLIAVPRPMNQVKYDPPTTSNSYCFNPLSKAMGNKKLTFFYEKWTAHLPIVQSPQDLYMLSEQYLKFFGPLLASKSPNFIKLCDIIISDLKQCSQEQRESWFNYFRNYIFPTIGHIEENAICVDKAYEVLKHFSAEDRFNLYGELHQVLSKNNPYVKLAYGKAEKATKDVLKRLSKENVKPMMMRLAKISISNPLPCFLTILQQLESYDNLNALVVKTAAYFNDYGWDNLVLAILMRLTTSGRSGVQQNGLNDRQWIQSLSSFIGKICQEFSQAFDLLTLSKYLLRSLHSAGTCDLIVMKEVLSSMGGLQAITNLTHLQISMINSEPCLEKIVYETIGDRRYENTRSGSAICNVLMQEGMVNEFFVLLCKLNAETVVGSEFSHLKVLASKKDELDSVTHYLCTLVGFFSKATPSALLPVHELIQKYNVPVPWAFEMWRKFLPSQNYGELTTLMRDSLAESVLESLEIDLFLSFWGMSLYDINYSDELYESELAKVVSKVSSLREEYSFARRDKNTSLESLDTFKKSIEENEKLIETIPQQRDHHKTHNEQKIAVLHETSSKWFSKDISANTKSISSFLENCVLPRCIHSSFDAIYSATAIFKLHEIQAKGFSVISCLDQFFTNKILFATLFTCTAIEAENLGLFVSAILKKLGSWSNSETFEKSTSLVGADGQQVSFSEYRATLYRYHGLILEDVKRALSVTTYMSRMNAITFLKNLMGVYPTVEDHCEEFIELMENISRKENRDDLKLSSSAMIGHVKSRKAQWVHLWDFVELEESVKAKHVAKREKIKALEKQKAKEASELKLRLQEEENRKRREEEARLLEKEKVEQRRIATANAIKYEDSSSSRVPTRDMTRATATSRGDAISKDRYQSYANNGLKKTSEGGTSRDATQSKAPSVTGSTRSTTAPANKTENGTENESNKDDKGQSNGRNQGTGRTGNDKSHGSERSQGNEKSSDEKQGTSGSNLLLKAKLEEARKEQANRNKEVSRSPAPRAGDVKNESRTPSSNQTTTPRVPSGPRTGSSSRARVPLPPQRLPQPQTSRGSALNGRERTYSSGEASQTDRFSSNSRDSQASSSKGSSYKPPTPRESQVPPKPSTDKKLPPLSGPQTRARPPLPPQSAPRDDRGGYGRGDGRHRNGRTYEEKQSSGRSEVPLPPPPVPPPAKRDAHQDIRKRRYEGSGREYDKRQRY